MAIKPIDRQRLDALYAEHHGQYGGCKEDYFPLLYLTRTFKVEVEEIAHQVAFNGNDYGIDAYLIDRAARNLLLFQFKWSEDHAQFKGSMERLARDGLERVFGSTAPDPNLNPVLAYLRKDLNEYREAINKVYVRFVFKGNATAAENSESLLNRREEILVKRYLITNFFARDVELLTEITADVPGLIVRRSPTQSYAVHMEEAGITNHQERTMRVGFVPLMDLYRIYEGLGETFFDRNIRGALSPDNKPNQKIREALDQIVLRERRPVDLRLPSQWRYAGGRTTPNREWPHNSSWSSTVEWCSDHF